MGRSFDDTLEQIDDWWNERLEAGRIELAWWQVRLDLDLDETLSTPDWDEIEWESDEDVLSDILYYIHLIDMRAVAKKDLRKRHLLRLAEQVWSEQIKLDWFAGL